MDLVVREAQNFDYRLMTWSNWNEIYDLCLRSGLFQLSLPIAYKIECSLDNLIQNSKLSPDQLRRSVPIAIRLGNIELMKGIFDHIDSKNYLYDCSHKVTTISPIVNAQSLKGPTAKMMQELGQEVSVQTIAKLYKNYSKRIRDAYC